MSNTEQSDTVKGAHCGRRGRKHRKQAKRSQKQQQLNERERKEELDRRNLMLPAILSWVTKLCSRSEAGVIVQRHIQGKYPRQMSFIAYCVDGRVTSSLMGVEKFTVREVQPWSDMSPSQLKLLVRRHWKPFWPKNILQIIADEV